MTDITNISPRYPTIDHSYSQIEGKKDKNLEKDIDVEAAKKKQDKSKWIDIEEAIQNDPELKVAFDKMVKSYSSLSPETQNLMSRVVRALIELNQAFNKVAIAYADHLGKITEKLQGYSTLQGQIPVITDGMGFRDSKKDVRPEDDKDKTARGEYNQRFSNALQAVQANKGIEEDKAKKVNAIMSSIKDAGQQASDFLTSFLDLTRQLATKFFQ